MSLPSSLPFTSECATCHDDGFVLDCVPAWVDAGGGYGFLDAEPVEVDCPDCRHKETANGLQPVAA